LQDTAASLRDGKHFDAFTQQRNIKANWTLIRLCELLGSATVCATIQMNFGFAQAYHSARIVLVSHDSKQGCTV